MPTRQEELEVALRDSITPGLKAIARELKALNQAAREAGTGTEQEINRIAASTQSLAQTSRNALRDVQSMMLNIVNYGKSILGVGGTVEAVNMLTRSLNDLATTRVQLAMFSQDTRITVNDIEKMRGAMSRMGIEAKTADSYIAGMSTKLQELRAMREGSTLFQELNKMGPGGAKLAQDLMSEQDVHKQIQKIEQVFKSQTPEVQFYMAQLFGVPPSVLLNLDAYEKKVSTVLLIPEEVAQKYLDQMIKFRQQADAEWTLFGAHAMEAINKWFDYLNKAGSDATATHAISKFFIDEFDAIDKGIQTTMRELQFFWDLLKQLQEWGDRWADYWNPKKADERPVEGKQRLEDAFKAFGAATRDTRKSEEMFFAADQMRIDQENNKLLESIKSTLQRLETGEGGGGGVGIRGGGIAGGGRAASQGDVTGPFQAGGGGFRPGGGVKGAKLEGSTEAIRARTFGTLADQRAPYIKYLNDHPELKAKLAGLLVSEEPSREGRVGVAETFLNRMIANGIPPEQMGTSIAGLASGSNVYYAPLRPGGSYERSASQLAANPELMKRTLEDIDKAGSGSNVSNLGTQNASAGVAANAQSQQTVTRGAIPGISDQYSRKDVRPDIHGPGTVARESDWYEKTTKAMRDNIDGAAAKSSGVFDKGTAAVTVDFGNLKQQTDESKEGGNVFKPLNNQREPQSPKSGGESGANFNDRWHFQ